MDIVDNVQENIINVEIFINDDKLFLQNFYETAYEYQFPPSTSILSCIDSVIIHKINKALFF